MRTDVLNRIKETLRKVIPAGGHAFLYGSQARNEARPDSDWGILILLDKPKIEVEDYDNISYPLVGLGWLLNECVSPVLYTLKDWMRYHFSPFVHSVKDKGIQFLSAEDITADSRCKHNGVVGQLELNYVSKGLLTKDES